MKRTGKASWCLWIVSLVFAAAARAQNPCGDPGTPYATLTFGGQTQTVCGLLDSIQCDPDSRVPAFLGIPYATAARWQAPALYVPAGSPPPNFQATQYGAICPQDPAANPAPCTQVSQCSPPPASQPLPASENCQFLNVWTPPGAAGGGRSYPVMVWIHGGAFIEGAGSSPGPSCAGNIFDGAYLAKENNIVVVSFNYRLGALGFLASSETGTSGTYLAQGNYGLMDQQLAIRWVIDHIAAFGGDPANIVLAGESAGAMSVGMHLTGATNLGNIAGGIMQSNPLGVPMKPRADAQKFFFAYFLDYFQNQQGNSNWPCATKIQNPICASGDTDAACFAKVQAQGATSDILAAQDCAETQFFKWLNQNQWNGLSVIGKALELFMPWAPIVDGTVYDLNGWNGSGPIPTQPFPGQTLALAGSVDKPVLLGTNRNEGLVFNNLGHTVATQTSLQTMALGIFGADTSSTVLAHYPATDSGSNYTDPGIQILADYAFTCANQYFAQQAAAHTGVWAYQFNEVSPFYPGKGASLTCCSSQSCPQPYCGLGGACGATNSYCCLGTTCHAAELPYVFADTSLYDGWTSDQKLMAGDMAEYWGNFVESPVGGPSPTSANMASWPRFTGSNYLLMNTAQSDTFTVGDVVTSMADAPAIDCSLFQACYSNPSFPACSTSTPTPARPSRPARKGGK